MPQKAGNQSKFLTHQPIFGRNHLEFIQLKLGGFAHITTRQVTVDPSPCNSKKRLGGAIPSINSSKASRVPCVIFDVSC